MAGAGADLHILSETAAAFARAAAIGAQFLAPDDNRAGMLGRLDRHGHHAGGEGCGIEPVERGARAGAAGIEGQNLGAAAFRCGGADRHLEIA